MIIDAHSHIGCDWMMPRTKIQDYKALLKKHDINAGIVMPEPGHTRSGKRLLLWEFKPNGGIHYFSPYYKTDNITTLNNVSKEINEEIYHEVFSNEKNEPSIFFSAMIHPVIDDVEYYKEIKSIPRCVALKIHGIAGGYSPEMIDKKHIEAIRETQLPIIIHTDYDKNNKSDLGIIRNMNSPRKWYDFLITNDLKGYLCHGCRLDTSLLKEISKSDNILVGLGPDFVIQNDKNRLIDDPIPSYLSVLSSYLPKEKIAFDIDYCYMDGDDSFIERIVSSLPESYVNFVMGLNASSFFRLDDVLL